jgi:hypothetical protein
LAGELAALGGELGDQVFRLLDVVVCAEYRFVVVVARVGLGLG